MTRKVLPFVVAFAAGVGLVRLYALLDDIFTAALLEEAPRP